MKDHLNNGVEEPEKPRGQDQKAADDPADESDVPQGVTYGHIAVNGHGNQKEGLGTAQPMEEEDLGHAAHVGDGLTVGEEASQHHGRSDGAVAEVQES